MNLKFSVLNNLTKDLEKTDIWGNLVFTWLPYWMSKINFCYILTLKYQASSQNILNIYSLYKNSTIMEQIKPNIVNIYLKAASVPPIEAYFAISKIEKSAFFEWLII